MTENQRKISDFFPLKKKKMTHYRDFYSLLTPRSFARAGKTEGFSGLHGEAPAREPRVLCHGLTHGRGPSE